MTMRAGLTIAIAVSAITIFGGMAAAETVTINGCAYRGVEPGCVMMRGPTGTVYVVSSAKPPVPINTRIRLHGTVTNDLSFCFARVLKKISWRRIGGVCPL